MRPFITIASFLFFISCAVTGQKTDKPQDWAEEQKRKFYIDSFAFPDQDYQDRSNSITFKTFMNKLYPQLKAKNKYDQLIYALEERYIDTTQIDTSTHWFRITVNPVFRKPYCLILTKNSGRSFLTTKVTNGMGGYYPGMLAAQLRLQFKDTVYDNTLRNLQDIGFWKLPIQDTTCISGYDGENWKFELIEGGKYQILDRWVPQSCGDGLTRRLALIGLRLRELGKLDNILTAIGAPKSGM